MSKKVLFSLIGITALLIAYPIGKKYGDPVKWLSLILGVLSLLRVVSPELWPPVKTVGRCILTLFGTMRTNFEWTRVLAKSGPEAEPMMLAFLRRYNKEEVCDIGGRNQKKHFVVTNFVAYSSLVSTVVHAACDNCPDDSDVVCFTTLTMPLCKWFNFSEIPNSPFRYCQIHPGWESYTLDIRRLLESYIHLRRCILTVEDDLAKQNENDPSFSFKSQTEMKNSCNYWILASSPKSSIDLKPIEKTLITNWLNNDLKPLASDLNFYKNAECAYLILPNGNKKIGELPCPQGFKWFRLGRVFLQLFHSQPPSDTAICKVLTYDDWKPYFDPTLTAEKRMPEDLFIIGFRKKAAPQDLRWVLCLAADIDKALDKLSLEFISESLSKSRFQLVTGYINWLYREGTSNALLTWLER